MGQGTALDLTAINQLISLSPSDTKQIDLCISLQALYMDIVQVLPAQLTQVQDLLVEKELRLHVTPEELEILRVDS